MAAVRAPRPRDRPRQRGADGRPRCRAPRPCSRAAARIAEAQAVLVDEIQPIDDMRSTAAYRRRVSANLLAQFWTETATAHGPRDAAVRGGTRTQCRAVDDATRGPPARAAARLAIDHGACPIASISARRPAPGRAAFICGNSAMSTRKTPQRRTLGQPLGATASIVSLLKLARKASHSGRLYAMALRRFARVTTTSEGRRAGCCARPASRTWPPSRRSCATTTAPRIRARRCVASRGCPTGAGSPAASHAACVHHDLDRLTTRREAALTGFARRGSRTPSSRTAILR